MVLAQMSTAQKCLHEGLTGELFSPLSAGIGKKLIIQISETKREFHWLKTKLVHSLCWFWEELAL